MADRSKVVGVPWKTPECYPLGRVAEFVCYLKTNLLVKEEDILEYITESEHQDGDEFLSGDRLDLLVEDFKLYVEEKDG